MNDQNAQKNVSAGGGVLGGYCYRAPVGAELPDSYMWTPTSEYVCMGYIHKDGVKFATDMKSDGIYDLNGDNVGESGGTHDEDFSVQFLELKKAVLESQYGTEQVSDKDGELVWHENGNPVEDFTYVFLFLLRDGRRWVRTAECAKLMNLEELVVNAENPVSRPAKFKAKKGDVSGDYYTNRIESTETTATGGGYPNEGEPSMKWTKTQLIKWCEANNVELELGMTKEQILAAISAASE